METKPVKPLIDSPKKTLKELCPEDKARVGQLVQKLAIEKANRKKTEEKSLKEESELNRLLDLLKSEQASLLRENETIQESLLTSMSQIESLQNSQILHSVESNFHQKTSSQDMSVCTQFKESVSLSVQTVPEREQPPIMGKFVEKENFEKKRFVGEDMKRVIEKAQETSARLEKFFYFNSESAGQSFWSEKGEICGKCEKSFQGLGKKDRGERDEEIIVIDEPFYDSHLLDVIDQMEDFE
jgi:hypothetical protein